MSQRFAEFDPAEWTEDDVLVIRKLARASTSKPSQRSGAPWKSSFAPLSFFGLATATAMPFAAGHAGSAQAMIVSSTPITVDVRMQRAGPGRDVVPSGYWAALDHAANRMPELDEDDAEDVDDEPFI